MKLVRTLSIALGLTLSSSALAGAALADEPCEHGDGYQNDGYRSDDQNGGWQVGYGDNDSTQWTAGRWDGRDGRRPDRPGRHGDRWDGWTTVGFVNMRDQPVTLFLNGQFLARLAPNSRERVTMPAGNHIVTYQVGWRHRYHQISVSAFEGQRNRVVIEGRRNWGGYGW